MRPRRLLEVSLTNVPAIDGMSPVEAHANENLKEGPCMKEALIALLGLKADAPDEAILAAA